MIKPILAILGFVTAVLFLTTPSEADIRRCAETTNYTVKRCRLELIR